MTKKPPIPPSPSVKEEEEKIFDISLRRKDGRLLLFWKLDGERAREFFKEKAEDGGAKIAGSVFDRLSRYFKKEEE